MNSEHDSGAIETILQHRQRLEGHIRQLKVTAARHLSAGDPATADVDLLGLLDDVAELIALKESSGYFDEFVESADHHRQTVRQLQVDHRRLLEELQAMRTELPRRPRRVIRLLEGWLTRFGELAHREAGLLQDIWNVDIGLLD